MTLSDIGKEIVKLGAPLLGTVIGGPAGGAIGALVASQFGGDANKPHELLQKIQANPDAAIKLAEIEAENKFQLEQLANQNLQIDMADTANARDREVNLAKIEADKGLPIDRTPRDLALTYTYGYMLTMFLSMVGRFFYPNISFDTIIAALSGGQMFILGYYFGSSNKEKK